MKHNTKIVLLSAAGILLSASNALAAVASSTDVVGNLGFFSVLAGTIMTYSKYVAFFMAIISLVALWVSGMLAKLSHKVEGAIKVLLQKIWLFYKTSEKHHKSDIYMP